MVLLLTSLAHQKNLIPMSRRNCQSLKVQTTKQSRMSYLKHIVFIEKAEWLASDFQSRYRSKCISADVYKEHEKPRFIKYIHKSPSLFV
jgi:hypothetical protein